MQSLGSAAILVGFATLPAASSLVEPGRPRHAPRPRLSVAQAIAAGLAIVAAQVAMVLASRPAQSRLALWSFRSASGTAGSTPNIAEPRISQHRAALCPTTSHRANVAFLPGYPLLAGTVEFAPVSRFGAGGAGADGAGGRLGILDVLAVAVDALPRPRDGRGGHAAVGGTSGGVFSGGQLLGIAVFAERVWVLVLDRCRTARLNGVGSRAGRDHDRHADRGPAVGILSAAGGAGWQCGAGGKFTSTRSWQGRGRQQFCLALVAAAASLGGLAFFAYCQWRFGAWDLYLQAQRIGWQVSPNYLWWLEPTSYVFFASLVYPNALWPDDLSRLCTLLTVATFAALAVCEVRAARRGDTQWRGRLVYYTCAAVLFYVHASGVSPIVMKSMLRYSLGVHALLLLAVAQASGAMPSVATRSWTSACPGPGGWRCRCLRCRPRWPGGSCTSRGWRELRLVESHWQVCQWHPKIRWLTAQIDTSLELERRFAGTRAADDSPRAALLCAG